MAKRARSVEKKKVTKKGAAKEAKARPSAVKKPIAQPSASQKPERTKPVGGGAGGAGGVGGVGGAASGGARVKATKGRTPAKVTSQSPGPWRPEGSGRAGSVKAGSPVEGLVLGSHLSIAGAMTNAVQEAAALGLDTVQVFTKNQQQWRAPALTEEVVSAWKREVSRLGWQDRTVSHASYLINLASPDDELWRKSIDLMQDEIERCERLGIPFLVHHPGAFTTSSLEAGLERIASAYKVLFARTAGFRTVSCLENTAGGGSTIGRDVGELSRLRGMIIEKTGSAARVGYCLDTCHLHAGGYDLSSEARAKESLERVEAALAIGGGGKEPHGFAHVRVLHVNDSKGAAGSRLDRHQHIGDGTIAREAFALVLRHPGLRHAPKIMETPKGEEPDGTAWDSVNAARLRALAG